jgi:hypothetical protein
MKTLKAICPTLLLALILVVPAYAGDIQTPGAPAPPPPPSPMLQSPESDSASTLTAECSTSGDITTDFAEILWALASIF